MQPRQNQDHLRLYFLVLATRNPRRNVIIKQSREILVCFFFLELFFEKLHMKGLSIQFWVFI